MKLGDNLYEPMWVEISRLPEMLVFPLEIKDWFLKDRQDNFKSCPREAKIERKVVHGGERSVMERLEKSPSQTINTAYIERSNLDWRLWDAHLARKAPTVARSMRWLKAKFAICVACYNLIRSHETLSRGQDRIFRAKTPAMAGWLSCAGYKHNDGPG